MFQSSFYPWPPPVFLLVVSPSHRLCASSRCAPAWHRLPRFASSHLPPFSVSLLQQSGSKYTLSLLQQSSISVPRLPQKSACFTNLPSSSMRLGSIRSRALSFPFALPLFPFRTNHSPSRSSLSEFFFFPSIRCPRAFVLISYSWIDSCDRYFNGLCFLIFVAKPCDNKAKLIFLFYLNTQIYFASNVPRLIFPKILYFLFLIIPYVSEYLVKDKSNAN